MSKLKLEQSREAHQAVCEMLQFAYHSDQMERKLRNLKRLLELEIAALEAALPDGDDQDGDDGVAAD